VTATLAGAWYVYGVSSGNTLSIRRAPGTGSPVIGTFAPGARPIYLYDGPQNSGSVTWVRVALPAGASGWVSLAYLRPLASGITVRGSASAALKKASQTAASAIRNRNWATLAGLVHPTKGVTYMGRTLTASQVRTASTNKTVYVWRSLQGEPTKATILKQLVDLSESYAFTSTTAIGYGVRLTSAGGSVQGPGLPPGQTFVDYFNPGTSLYGNMDWLTVRLVFDTRTASPKLVSIDIDEWQP